MTECMVGLGLRSVHYPYLRGSPKTKMKWFEAISENYMDTHGKPRAMLDLIRSNYHVALHGVSLSIASAEGLNERYLGRLRQLVDEIQPFIVSDHLCWTGTTNENTHDLLPFPYHQDSLNIVLDNVDLAQNRLGRTILLENISSYMRFLSSEMTEFEFITHIAQKSGAKILLDINNVFVTAKNLNLDAKKCLDSINPDLVGQIHLAGFSDTGEFLFDTHSKPVYPDVWDLFSYFIKKCPNVPFMIEWDDDIPDFLIVEEEALKAKNIWDLHHGQR
jgi:uncharacterized protein (UPF0276 family)